MAFRTWLLAYVSAAFLLGGCASVKVVDPKDETVSLVFGYFDMADAPSRLEWVSVKSYGGENKWYTAQATKTGVFFHIGVPPGSYQVDVFGGMGGIPLLTAKEFRYNFGNNGRNDTAIRIQKPGVYFMGAYKYIDHPGGFFKEDKFEMKATNAMSEKEVLTKVIAELESDSGLKVYTHQIDIAKKRLASLR